MPYILIFMVPLFDVTQNICYSRFSIYSNGVNSSMQMVVAVCLAVFLRDEKNANKTQKAKKHCVH